MSSQSTAFAQVTRTFFFYWTPTLRNSKGSRSISPFSLRSGTRRNATIFQLARQGSRPMRCAERTYSEYNSLDDKLDCCYNQ